MEHEQDIYVRKDVWQAEMNHLLSEPDAANKRIEDVQHNVNTMLGFAGVVPVVLVFVVPFVITLIK